MGAQIDIIPDNSARQLRVGSLLGERFLLEEVITDGTIGVVYKASDRTLADGPHDGSRIAVRVLAPELAAQESELRALQREVARIRCLAHPHIARFIDFHHDGDHYYLAVEWLDGRTLASILDSAEAQHIDRVYAFRIARQLGEALDYAHRCGIVHGGIDPAKVMIMPNGDARLFDFGLASFRQRLLENREKSGGAGVGAMAYSSLQVLGGETPVISDDIFSLACLLYRLVAGYRVFGPRNAAAASQAGMTPQRPQGFTDLQWIAMSNALSYERESRYHGVSDFAAALADNTAAQLSSEREEQPRVAAASNSHRWVVAVVTGMAMLAGVTVKTGLVEPEVSPVAALVPVAEAPAIAPEATAEKPSMIDLPMSIERPVPVTVRNVAAAAKPEVVEEPVTKPALPLNAIGFSADRAFVNESDPAVQIDVMRFNADDQSLSIRYAVESISATEGEDYFAPGSLLLSFGPRQRTARLLVPLVQDSVVEGEELFALRLVNTAAAPSVYGYQQILVTIRDDDPQAP